MGREGLFSRAPQPRKPVPMERPHDVLGLAPGASIEEVRRERRTTGKRNTVRAPPPHSDGIEKERERH